MSDPASSPASRYSATARAIHWASALFVVCAWTLGLLGDELPRGALRHAGEFAHVTLGELVVALLVLRLVWRFLSPPPPAEPTRLGLAGSLVATLVLAALYGLLLAVPLLGLTTLFHGGESLSLLGLYDIPSPWPKNRELKHYSQDIHELFAHLLMMVAAFHASAALVHHFLLRDRTLKRMLPGSLAD